MSSNGLRVIAAVHHQVHKDVSLVREDPKCKESAVKSRNMLAGSDQSYNLPHMQCIEAGLNTLPLAVQAAHVCTTWIMPCILLLQGLWQAWACLDAGGLQRVEQVVQHCLLEGLGKHVKLVQDEHHSLVAPACICPALKVLP